MNDWRQRVTVDPAVMTGQPCIRGLRIPVTNLLGLMASGASGEEILAEYPDLESADLQACLAFAAWRSREREVELQLA